MLFGAAAAAVVLPAIISSHEYFVGGAVAGPRYLTAGLAFSLFPIAAFLGSARGRLRGNWDRRFRDLLRFRVRDDGTLADMRVFFPMRKKPVHSRIDGLAVDRRGNVYFCGHDGIWVLSPAGRPLGLIQWA